jgi:hypothetical protein
VPSDEPPSHWFARNCFISGEPGEPGYRYCVEAGLEDNLLVATDFPHPEDEHFPAGLQRAFDPAIADGPLRKLLSENAAALYGL